MKSLTWKVALAFFVISVFSGPNLLCAEDFLADHTVAGESVLCSIPASAIQAAKDNLHILYFGASHSSPLMTGMRGVMDCKPDDDTLYGFTHDGDPEPGKLDIDYNPLSPTDVWSAGDLSHDSADSLGHTDYYYRTVEYLDHPDHADVNVVMWSWCPVESHNVKVYLKNFEELINMYRAGGSKGRTTANEVKFVFMTGYAGGNDGDDPATARSPINNALAIKQYCQENGHYCIDYWSRDTSTRHLTENRLACAAWYVWARLGGWTGGMVNRSHYVVAGDEDIMVRTKPAPGFFDKFPGFLLQVRYPILY